MFVVHDGQKLVHRQHLSERFGPQQLLSAAQRDGVAQRPVRVIRLHQVVYSGHRLLRPVHLHPLAADVTERRDKQLESGVQQGALYTYRLLYSSNSWSQESSRGRCTPTDSCTHIKQLESGVQQGALYTYRLLHSYQTAGVRSPAGGAVHIQTLALISNSWSQESSRGRCTHTDSCTHIKQLESGVQQGALYTYRLLHSSNSWSQESSRGRCTPTDSCTHIKQLESGVQQGALYTYRLLHSYQTAGVRSPAGGAVHIQTLALISNSWSQEFSRGRCTHTDSCTQIKQLESGVQQGALYTYRLLHSYQTAGVRSPAGGAVHIQTAVLIKQLESGVQQGALYTYRLLYSSNSWSQESSRGRCTHTDSCTHIKQLESGVSRGRCTHTDSCTHIKQLESGVQQGALYTYRLLHSYQTAGVRSPAGGAVHIQTLALISNSWSQESSRGRCTHTDSCTHQTAGVRSPAGGAVHIQTLALISNSWSQESSRGRCTHTDSCTHIKQLESGVQQGALYTYRLLHSYQTAGVRSPAGGAVHIQTAVLTSDPSPAAETRSHASDSAGDA